jgi:site-specific DNA recombinase
MERLLTAYQEELLSLDELRRRMPELRQRESTLQAEIQALSAQVADQAAYLRLAQTLSAFLTRLRANADTLDIVERQQIVRLLVKEVLVGHDSIIIRHSIPNLDRTAESRTNRPDLTQNPKKIPTGKNSLLRPWRDNSTLRRTLIRW